MLISALNEYYDKLAAAGKVSPPGMTRQKISYMIMLRPDGTVSNINDVREETQPDAKGKTKKELREMDFPERPPTTAIVPYLADHRPLYIFGLSYDKNEKRLTPDGEKAEERHKKFVEYNLEFTEGLTSPIVTAFRNFLINWKPGDETENPKLTALDKDYAGGNYCFALDGHPEITLHGDKGLLEKWRAASYGEAEPDGVCAVSGEPAVIARIHDKIKGVRGGQATGTAIVCFNSPAEESYGRSQSYNSSISQNVMKRYTEALNLLISDKGHCMYVEDLTMVFWAQSENDGAETDIFRALLNGDEMDADETNAMLRAAVKEIAQGRNVDLSAFDDVDENVTFYVVGLAPNVARVSQKFIYRDKFGEVFKNVAGHQADMMQEGGEWQIPLWRILKELISPKSKNDKVSPPLIASLFSAIINGYRYPDSLLETAVRRVKVDKNVNYVRAGIIKACVNRRSRFNNEKEEIKMALDKNNTNPAYLCGRLFAVLERIQRNAAEGELNKTIKDSYFASACAKPQAVFTQLMRLAQYHMKKDDYAERNNRLIGEIIDKLGDSFPSTLPLAEQGKFIIGYYQQVQNFYEKSGNSVEKNETNENNNN